MKKAKLTELGAFQQGILGKWANAEITKGKGGPPYSYNVMALPEISDVENGYIVKNFRYAESVDFKDGSGIIAPADAPNRGGQLSQHSEAVFYEQVIKYVDAPEDFVGHVVHEENGAWLYLRRFEQSPGSFPPREARPAPPAEQQPLDLKIAKQISVPHGNSVLAVGNIELAGTRFIITGAPNINSAPAPYPADVNTAPFNMESHDAAGNFNPDKEASNQPNKNLQEGMTTFKPGSHVHWRVNTAGSHQGQAGITNILFEFRKARALSYEADYWLISEEDLSDTQIPTDNDDGIKAFWRKFNYLAYTQTMEVEIYVKNNWKIFRHVTCNLLQRMA